MDEWKQLLRDGVNNSQQLFERFGIDKDLGDRIAEDFEIRVNAYYLSLDRGAGVMRSGNRSFPTSASCSMICRLQRTR